MTPSGYGYDGKLKEVKCLPVQTFTFQGASPFVKETLCWIRCPPDTPGIFCQCLTCYEGRKWKDNLMRNSNVRFWALTSIYILPFTFAMGYGLDKIMVPLPRCTLLKSRICLTLRVKLFIHIYFITFQIPSINDH